MYIGLMIVAILLTMTTASYVFLRSTKSERLARSVVREVIPKSFVYYEDGKLIVQSQYYDKLKQDLCIAQLKKWRIISNSNEVIFTVR